MFNNGSHQALPCINLPCSRFRVLNRPAFDPRKSFKYGGRNTIGHGLALTLSNVQGTICLVATDLDCALNKDSHDMLSNQLTLQD